MLSILVCHSYYLRFDQKQLERGKPYPALATLQVAAMLRKAGHKVSFFDAMLADGVEEFNRRLRAVEPQAGAALRGYVQFPEQDVLGRDAPRRLRHDRLRASRRRQGDRRGSRCQRRSGPVSSGRRGCGSHRRGAVALLEVLPRLDSRPQARSHELIDGLSGVASLSRGKVVTANGARVLPIPHYDGFAAWDLVDMDRYRAVWLKRHGYFSLNMAGSRGCSFRCAWCAKPTWGNHYLQRSAGGCCNGNGLS